MGAVLGLTLALTACGQQAAPPSAPQTATPITIGVTIPIEANSTLAAWYHAIEASAKVHHMKVIGLNDQLQVAKQVDDIHTLLSEHVNALIVWPLDAASLQPALQAAQRQHVPVYGIDFNVKPGGPRYGLATQVVLRRDEAANAAAALIAKSFPHGADVAGIGLAVPVPGNVYLMQTFQRAVERYPNLHWVGQQNNPSDNAAGAEPLVANLLTKDPHLQAIFCYNDPSAEGAARAVLDAHRQLYSPEHPEGIMVIGVNAQPSGVTAIQAGQEYATFNLEPVESGVALVDAVYDDLVLHWGSKLPEEIDISLPMVDRANLGTFVAWSKQIQEVAQHGPSFLEPPQLLPTSGAKP